MLILFFNLVAGRSISPTDTTPILPKEQSPSGSQPQTSPQPGTSGAQENIKLTGKNL